MNEDINIDLDYLEAFNLGYEIAKELDLKSPMFKDIKPENYRLGAVQAGMHQRIDELRYLSHMTKSKSNEQISRNTNHSKKTGGSIRGKGLTFF